MSKIGKKPVVIREGVTVDFGENVIEVKSGDNAIAVPILPGIKVEKKENELIFIPADSTKQTVSNWGTMRALTENAVEGVAKGFTKSLAIEGVGYRANIEGEDLVLSLGYSHLVRFNIPKGIRITSEKNMIHVAGQDKQLVGETAARIRRLRKPEPYKGKGIRYSNEVIKRKAGKKAVGKTG
ncbi:MAG: 50S ribosomal protein L6 [Candidatus Colwellbacteria bacterium]|nr:50S ribosomal protein L6 [Candidatus Colwellbacteria bacterium]